MTCSVYYFLFPLLDCTCSVLCVNSFERRVLVVESLLAPSVVRDCLARVLFQRFDVPALLLAPAHLLALLPLGSSLPPAASTQQLQPAASTASASAYSSTSLVLDVGFEEALVVPVSEGITLVGSLQSASLGMRAALKCVYFFNPMDSVLVVLYF